MLCVCVRLNQIFKDKSSILLFTLNFDLICHKSPADNNMKADDSLCDVSLSLYRSSYTHTHSLILREQADTHLQIKQVGGKTYFALWENLG